MKSKDELVQILINIFWSISSDDKVVSKSLYSIESEEELPKELIPHFKEMEQLYDNELTGEVLDEYSNVLEKLNPSYYSERKAFYHQQTQIS